jgi:hypothetical protein
VTGPDAAGFSDRVRAMGVGAASTQLNIVLSLDVAGVVAGRPAAECAWLFDNDPRSVGDGTAALRTYCTPGQVLNFIIYPVDGYRRPDGSFPDFPQIEAIVFYQDQGGTQTYKTLGDLRIYGAPDRMRSPWTPVYRYWAGAVEREIEPGIYPYRLILSLPGGPGGGRRYFELDTASLEVGTPDGSPAPTGSSAGMDAVEVP